MLVLGVDTSTPAVSVALVDLSSGRTVEWVVVDARRHGEVLAVGIRAVLAEAGVDRRAVGAVAAGLGPGPFTGLRVGIVTVAALAHALGVPALGVCSLDALGTGERVVLTDARRREVYWARYDRGGHRVEGPAVSKPAELVPALTGLPVMGDGALVHAELLAGLDVRTAPRYPSAAAVARLAATAGPCPDGLLPLYLRRPDAQQPGAPKRVTA